MSEYNLETQASCHRAYCGVGVGRLRHFDWSLRGIDH